MEPARIKGAAVREFLRWYSDAHGNVRLRELPPSLARVFDPRREAFGVLAATWYPADEVHALLDVVTRGMTPRSRLQLADAGGRRVVEGVLSGVYRTLFNVVGTPERYARFAQRFWGSFYDTGVIVVDESKPQQHTARIDEWSGHHPFICELTISATRTIYESMGCLDVRTERLSCIDGGAAVCAFQTSWRKR